MEKSSQISNNELFMSKFLNKFLINGTFQLLSCDAHDITTLKLRVFSYRVNMPQVVYT
jgi:hypothetical protein